MRFHKGWGLKGVKIAQNIVKVGVHAYLSNGHPNLWSNFNFEKLIRSETPSCIFARVGLKGVQIDGNITKVGVHIFISNEHPNLWSNFNFENLVKSETPSFNFAKVWLKGGENGFEKLEIARNPLKFCMHGYLSIGYVNSLSNFNYRKVKK